MQYSSGQITYDAPGTLSGLTYDQLPEIAYDSPFWLVDQTIPGVLIGNVLYSLTGDPGTSWLRTGDFGDMNDYSTLGRATPRYRTIPATASGTNFYRATLGEAATQDSTITISRGRFDFRRDSRWHSVRIDQTGRATINGIDIDINASSRE